ncbi:MAG TPA: hypothetical protein VE402_03595 [Candidatus Angelobacter sp.]|nr:hypothetical protein [Candidatus Angelobacter sp.]
MNCSELKRWLNEGMPQGPEPAARAHAARCPECAASLRAQLEIEALLSGERHPPVGAPPRFVDRVMAEVLVADRSGPRIELWPAAIPLPWWVQAAADPATALACVLVALLGWRIDWLGDLARRAGDLGSRYVIQSLGPTWSAMGLDRPAVTLGLELSVLPALAWGSIILYRWTERLSRSARA